MQLLICCPDSDYCDVVFTMQSDSVVEDAVQAASSEWGTDSDLLEMAYDGNVLQKNGLLSSHGLRNGSQLEISLLRAVTKEWLSSSVGKKKGHLLDPFSVATDTFSVDGRVGFESELLPLDLRTIYFSKPNNNIAIISDDFLMGSLITSIELSELCFIKTIKNNFLSNSAITQLDISGLNTLTDVGSNFMANCSSLSNFTLPSVASVESIENGFLQGCRSLIRISNLSSLRNLKKISDLFLFKCSSLVSLEMFFNHVEEIGSLVMCECLKLKTIDLSSLKMVTSIGNGFLRGCESLVMIKNIDGLEKINRIGDSFFHGCKSLEFFDISSFTKISRIGCRFLSDCEKLKNVDLVGFKNITKLEHGFLRGCTSLSSISNINGLGNVTHFEHTFACDCASLSFVDLTVFEKVENVGPYFLSGCRSLVSVDFSTFEKVTSLCFGFLQNCESLVSISSISGLRNVNNIGSAFLFGCTSLQSIDLTVFKDLEGIGSHFLNGCESLRVLNFSTFNSSIRIGENFLEGCHHTLKSISDISRLKNT